MRMVISVIFILSGACGSSEFEPHQFDLSDGGQVQKRGQSEPSEQTGSPKRETQTPSLEPLDAGHDTHSQDTRQDTRQDTHSQDTAPPSDALPAFLQPKQDAALTWKSKEVKPGVFLIYKGDDNKPIPFCQKLAHFTWYQIRDGKTYVFLFNSFKHCMENPDLNFPYPSITDFRAECYSQIVTQESVNHNPETIHLLGNSYTEIYVTNLMKVCSNNRGVCKFGACYDPNNKIIP